MSNKFQIEKVLVSSTLHINDEDVWLIEVEAESFDIPYEFASEEIYIRVCEDSKMIMNSASTSEGFALLYLFAESFGCKNIRFKADGPVYDGIPTYLDTEVGFDAYEAHYHSDLDPNF